MVFVRYVLNQNTIWQTDFVTWSLVAATFIGSPYLLLTRGHVNVDVLPLYLGPRARAGGSRSPRSLMSLAFCRGARGAHRALLARGVGAALGVGHDVARAAVDPLQRHADRPRHPGAAIHRRPVFAAQPAASRRSASKTHEPDHAGRDRAHRHADRAAVGRAGGVRPGRAVDRLSRASSRASTRCRWWPRRFTPG